MTDPPSEGRMFNAAVSALAEIDAALGLPEDGCNSTARTIAAIRKLKTDELQDRRDMIRLSTERDRLRESLKVIAEGTRCPELFPDLSMDTDEWEIQAKTAEVSAIAALEPRP